MADPLELQSRIQRIDAVLPTDVASLRLTRFHRVPTAAYLNLKRQTLSSTPGSLLMQLPSPGYASAARNGRRCIMASAAPLINSSHDPVKISFDKTAQLPPLAPSTVIPGLPPPPPPASLSKLHEADQQIKRLAEHCGLGSIQPWSLAGISLSNALHGGSTVDTDRFVAASSFYALQFMLDDLFFDAPHAVTLKEYGVSGSVCESPESSIAFFTHLHSLFRQEATLPRSPTPIEGIMWELGHVIQRLSTPAWFAKFAYASMDSCEATIASNYADRKADSMTGDRRCYEPDLRTRLETYSEIRVRTSGVRLAMMLVELASNVFLPDNLRAHPTVQKLVDAAGLHIAYVNDIFSYPKEMLEPCTVLNLVMLLIDHQSRRHDGTVASISGGLPRAVWEAVDLIKSHARMVTELEQQLFDTELDGADPEAAATLRTFIDNVKRALAGSFQWHMEAKRYQHQDSVFPELRVSIVSKC